MCVRVKGRRCGCGRSSCSLGESCLRWQLCGGRWKAREGRERIREGEGKEKEEEKN